MAIIQAIPITDADLDVYVRSLNYQTTIPDPENPEQTIPNPMTKVVFARRSLIKGMLERIVNQKRQDAIEAANITEPAIT
jgi:hypothetical protein